MINWIKNIFKKKENTTIMSFKEGLNLTDLPIVTFYQGDRKLNFMLDTGANTSIIDSCLLGRIEYTPIKGKGKVFGVEGIVKNVDYVGLEFVYNKHHFKEIFQSLDMSAAFDNIKKESGVNLHGIIGNEFMRRYEYVLDFKEMIAYSKHDLFSK